MLAQYHYELYGIRYMVSLNRTNLRLITFERLVFVFPSILIFWDKSIVGIDSENLHIPVDVSPPIGCHGGTRSSMFGLQRMRNSTVNARDSQFILVPTLNRNRVIALRPVGVSLCVRLIVKCSFSPGTPPSFI